MTTLIAFYTSSGCEGRCDAKCYNATSPECTCICQGKNHGVGLQKAMNNTKEMVDQWIKDYRLTHELERAEVNQAIHQLAFAL